MMGAAWAGMVWGYIFAKLSVQLSEPRNTGHDFEKDTVKGSGITAFAQEKE